MQHGCRREAYNPHTPIRFYRDSAYDSGLPTVHQTTQIAEPELIVSQLVDIAWMYTFQTYFRLKKIEDERTRKKEAAEVEEQATAAGGEEAAAL